MSVTHRLWPSSGSSVENGLLLKQIKD